MKFNLNNLNTSKNSLLIIIIIQLIINIQLIKTSDNALNLNKNPLLLIITLDGFRWDYLNKYNLPNFNHLKSIGSYSDFIYSNFDTSTFPNHWSLVTGLYEETHGIISNEMYDPYLNETFTLSNPKTHNLKWFGQNNVTMPIWTLNQKNGNDRRSAAEFPGSNVVFDNQQIIHLEYNESMTFKQLIDKFIILFTANKTQSINFGAFYVNQPDTTGHVYGPFSNEMKLKLNELDNNLGYLLDQLKQFNLINSLNLILTSDHGMTDTSNKTVIILKQYVDTNLFEAHGGAVNKNLFLKDLSNLENVYGKLKQIQNIDVFKKNEIPDFYNYKNNRRVGDILVTAKLGYTIYVDKQLDNFLGHHGYDKNESSMHPFFIASGPRFKKNFKAENFKNVDIYPLMCKILDIKPGLNNGSLTIVQDLLLPDYKQYRTIYIIISIIPIISATLTAICLFYMNKPEIFLKMTSNNGYLRVSTSDLQIETNIDNNICSSTNYNVEDDNISANSDLVV